MLTRFGKEARKIRIEKNITAKELAERMQVTPSFLSAVETGRKEIPSDFIQRMSVALKLSAATRAALERSADASKGSVRVKMQTDASEGDRELVAMFARDFGGLSEKQKTKLRSLLEGSD